MNDLPEFCFICSIASDGTTNNTKVLLRDLIAWRSAVDGRETVDSLIAELQAKGSARINAEFVAIF